MKIRKLHIKNYKVFDNLELDFTDANGDTLDKIVLAGVNGCGKTTVLEIIKRMYDASIFEDFRKNKKSSIELEFELSKIEKDKYQGEMNFLLMPLNEFKLNYSLQLNSNVSRIFCNHLKHGVSQLFYMPVNAINGIQSTDINYNKNIQIIHLSSAIKEMKEMALKSIRDEIFNNKDMTPRQRDRKSVV